MKKFIKENISEICMWISVVTFVLSLLTIAIDSDSKIKTKFKEECVAIGGKAVYDGERWQCLRKEGN